MITRSIWVWLLLFGFAGNSIASDLRFVGTGSYTVTGNSVVLRADRVDNNEFIGISGTIRLELWAFSSPYPNTTVGYKLASHVVGQLLAGYTLQNINSGSIPLLLPPPGPWWFSLHLREYVGFGSDGYLTRDYINFSLPVRVSGGAYVGDVQILGRTTWQIIGNNVDLYVEQVRNLCNLGTSENLRLDLWATSTPYTSGTITGYRFASTGLNPLTAGSSYFNIDRTLTYVKPPDGTYYVTLTLSEYYNGNYLIINHLNYTNRLGVGDIPLAPVANPPTSVNSGGFTARWNAAAGATGYRLDISTSSTFDSYVEGYQNLDVGTTISRTVSGLTSGVTYYYRVRAYNGLGTSGNSGTIAVTLPCTYLITTLSAGGGTASGGGLKTCGGAVTVVATPGTGFRFLSWTDGGNVVSTTASYTFTASGDRTLVANFSDAQGPSIAISSPGTGTVYTNARTLAIFATVSDNVGVSAVEFYDGPSLVATSTTPPYTYPWSFTALENGPHVWTARASDNAGNMSTSSPVTLTVSIDIAAPDVTIASPTNGQRMTSRTVTVSGSATDPVSPASGVAVVQLRVNGGSWTNASGTGAWTRTVTLSPCENNIEARSLDRAGNYSDIRSVTVTYTGTNTAPVRPANDFPANGAVNVSVAPTLQGSAFVDLDCLGDTHTASRWQVLSGSTIVADSGTNTLALTSWTVPPNKLYFGSNYQWRVRYRDSRNGWSSNSTATGFTTAGPSLAGTRIGTNVVLTWPTNARGFTLQWTTNLAAANWSNAVSATIISGKYTVTNRVNSNGRAVYRLRK